MSATQPDDDLEKAQRSSPSRPHGSRHVSGFSLFSHQHQSPKNAEEDDEAYRTRADRIKNLDPLLDAHDKLAIFRRLTGIESAVTHTNTDKLHRRGANEGIYAHVVREEEDAQRKYKFFSRLINFCLGLQIVVAAALTALGAGNGPHAVVTVFGAVNTVIAGFLTYLKGSGLPNRTKFFANKWTGLRHHIEQRERDFGRQGHDLDVMEQVRIVEAKYHEIRMEIEANTPDGYTSVTRAKEGPMNVPSSSSAAVLPEITKVNHMPSTKHNEWETGGSDSVLEKEVGGMMQYGGRGSHIE